MCSSCGGSCNSGPCFCGDDRTSCVPTTECLSESNDCCPPDFYYDREIDCCTDILICNPPCPGDENCDKYGNCICNKTLYMGKTLADFKPSVTCYSDVMIVSVNSCFLNYLKYNVSDMHLHNESPECTTIYETIENNSRVYNTELKLTSGWCGNIMTNDSSKIYITNSLYIGILKEDLITVKPINFSFACGYNMSMTIGLNSSLHIISETIYIPGINGTGLYPLTMAAYFDRDFVNPIQETDTVLVSQDIFLGLTVKYADGDLFALRVQQCIASPNSDRSSPIVSLVTGGCAADDGVSTTVEENGISLDARIRISSFQFQGQSNVYIFCNVQLCDKKTNCTKCDLSRSSTTTQEVMINVPLQDDFSSYSNSGTSTALSWAVLSSTLLGFLSMNMF
ncbi:pancreatic secretory granule membrane major glycoprotein GP2-like [Mixophyes fleayi]|uniref:pancreatic secretory granule membrane major glycoprotein GP2-like n=1 Tax=Mixophyes fleayi TaxID=3061075 RepID=UPI003F4E1625